MSSPLNADERNAVDWMLAAKERIKELEAEHDRALAAQALMAKHLERLNHMELIPSAPLAATVARVVECAEKETDADRALHTARNVDDAMTPALRAAYDKVEFCRAARSQTVDALRAARDQRKEGA